MYTPALEDTPESWLMLSGPFGWNPGPPFASLVLLVAEEEEEVLVTLAYRFPSTGPSTCCTGITRGERCSLPRVLSPGGENKFNYNVVLSMTGLNVRDLSSSITYLIHTLSMSLCRGLQYI